MSAISINQVCKSYAGIKALSEISFNVEQGALFGLIGPDGAGKTTLFRILTTLLLQDEGTVRMLDLDVKKDYREIRRITGYMAGRFSLYQDLSVEENLRFYATVFGTTVEENYGLIRDIYAHLEPFRKRRAGKLSGGMKQKLALSCALIHKPSILILDEPTTGVDAVSRKEFWDMLDGLKGKDITIMVSTPYMDEAARCDRVALIQDGRILSVDSPSVIIRDFPYPLWAMRSIKMYRLLRDLESRPEVRSAHLFGQHIHVTLQPQLLENSMQKLDADLQRAGHPDLQVRKIDPGIEDCFMELMTKQRNLQDA